MNKFNKKFRKFEKQSFPVMFSFIFSKFLFGIGLGVLFATYFQTHVWIFWGWLLIIISLLLHIPEMYNLLIKK